jgi:hypothetical protein
MTIKSSKTAAAAIALLSGVVLAFLILVGLRPKQPALLALGGLFTALVVVTMLFLMRQTSLTLDGADLVYRVGGRERRTPRDTVSNCAVIGRRWVFTDAAGARVFSLPVLLFNEADLATFCNKVGIRGFAAPLGPVE